MSAYEISVVVLMGSMAAMLLSCTIFVVVILITELRR